VHELVIVAAPRQGRKGAASTAQQLLGRPTDPRAGARAGAQLGWQRIALGGDGRAEGRDRRAVGCSECSGYSRGAVGLPISVCGWNDRQRCQLQRAHRLGAIAYPPTNGMER
jgi:hypothetical protein